jgi:hypothetical protein
MSGIVSHERVGFDDAKINKLIGFVKKNNDFIRGLLQLKWLR